MTMWGTTEDAQARLIAQLVRTVLVVDIAAEVGPAEFVTEVHLVVLQKKEHLKNQKLRNLTILNPQALRKVNRIKLKLLLFSSMK